MWPEAASPRSGCRPTTSPGPRGSPRVAHRSTGEHTTTQCGSGQQANTWGHSLIASGMADIVIACGVESMTHVPLGSNVPRHADGEAMFGERFTPRYEELYQPTNQLEGGEMIADAVGHHPRRAGRVGRSFAAASGTGMGRGPLRYPDHSHEGAGARCRGQRVDTIVHDRDEGLRETTVESLATLKTIHGPDGVHTAGTASQIADGASALLLMSAEKAAEVGATPLARIVDSCLVGSDPVLMLTGPIPATQKLLDDNDLTIDDIDIFEINEAFGSVVAAWAKELDVRIDKVNPNGGAMAIGHALGSTGPSSSPRRCTSCNARVAVMASSPCAVAEGWVRARSSSGCERPQRIALSRRSSSTTPACW